MRWSDISFTDKTIRQFAVLCLFFFGVLALWQGLHAGNMALALCLAALGLIAAPVGLLRPGWLRPVYTVWMIAVFPVGWLVSHVVLALLYFGMFTPLAILFRLIRRDALQRKFQPTLSTYWQERPEPELKRYFRQY